MRKFLTERDINQLVAQGVKELFLEPGMVVTDLGKERARAARLRLIPPESTRPVSASPAVESPQSLQAQIRAAVIAHLGSAPADLEAIIARVLGELNLSS